MSNEPVAAVALSATESLGRAAGEAAREIDHDSTDQIVCPACGYEDPDSWQYPESTDLQCDVCGAAFRVQVEYWTTYTTTLKPPAVVEVP